MPSENPQSSYNDMARQILERVRQIRFNYPDVAEEMDFLEEQLRQQMQSFQQSLVSSLAEPKARDLLTIYIIHEIHKAVDVMLNQMQEYSADEFSPQ